VEPGGSVASEAGTSIPALTVRDLVVEIGERRVLDGVDLDVAAGERVALIGASGSGKTLTAMAVLGRLPAAAAFRGSVRLGNTEVLGVPAARRGRSPGAAAVFQDSLSALNPLVRTGVQLCAPLRRHRGLGLEDARRAAVELLASVGFDRPRRILRSYPGELSGGQRQRVCIALAVACDQDLVLADEPTTALDTVSQSQVLRVLRAQTDVRSAALLLVTHDIAAAAGLCERAVVLDRGRVVESAPLAELLGSPRHDYTRLLVDAARTTSLASARVTGATPGRRAAPGVRLPLLRATGLRRAYRLRRSRPFVPAEPARALRGVDLDIAAGERIGLVGASGSGKSTLLRVLLALEAPDAGRVRFRDREIRPARTSALRWYRRAVQYIAQDPASSLDPRMSVADLIAEPLARLRVPGDHRAAVARALEQVGLPGGYGARRPGELSGGQAQRVAIARAIATRPALLIADEPVSGLDLPLREQVVGVLGRMCAETGMGLLLVSHDLSVVAALCERTTVMSAGEIVEDRPTGALLAAPEHPRTRELIAAIPDLPAAGTPVPRAG
jgi:peptide/nickel transport system ATP-binding protein